LGYYHTGGGGGRGEVRSKYEVNEDRAWVETSSRRESMKMSEVGARRIYTQTRGAFGLEKR
jgi:hypothetical protein